MSIKKDLLNALEKAREEELKGSRTTLVKDIKLVLTRNFPQRDINQEIRKILSKKSSVTSSPLDSKFNGLRRWIPGKGLNKSSQISQKKREDVVEDNNTTDDENDLEILIQEIPGMNNQQILDWFGTLKAMKATAKELELGIDLRLKADVFIPKFREALGGISGEDESE